MILNVTTVLNEDHWKEKINTNCFCLLVRNIFRDFFGFLAAPTQVRQREGRPGGLIWEQVFVERFRLSHWCSKRTTQTDLFWHFCHYYTLAKMLIDALSPISLFNSAKQLCRSNIREALGWVPEQWESNKLWDLKEVTAQLVGMRQAPGDSWFLSLVHTSPHQVY